MSNWIWGSMHACWDVALGLVQGKLLPQSDELQFFCRRRAANVRCFEAAIRH